jgi:hypothetical protein
MSNLEAQLSYDHLVGANRHGTVDQTKVFGADSHISREKIWNPLYRESS